MLPISALRPEHFEAIYQGNIFTPLALIKALLPTMLERGQGTVINMLLRHCLHRPAGASGQWWLGLCLRLLQGRPGATGGVTAGRTRHRGRCAFSIWSPARW